MSYLFTSESVSEGHPDKVADQISDALIDHFMAFDPESKVACETLVTTGQVVLAGEVKTNTYLDVQAIARDVIRKIGYTKSEYMFEANSCGILSAIHDQSADINQGVDRAVANNDFATIAQGTPIVLNVLANDKAGDQYNVINPSSLTITNPPKNGNAVVNNDGTVTYSPSPFFVGTDSLEYQVCDNNNPVQCQIALAYFKIEQGCFDYFYLLFKRLIF
jgi:S-adenosylmethionine synthetase